MKLRNIFLIGFAGVSLASCSDYLDVDAPSKNTPEYVYTDKMEMNRALNGVYASLNNSSTYAQNFLDKFCFNTDVEFKAFNNQFSTSNSYQRYDCDADGSDIKKAWDALYQGIERANMLDAGIRNSDIYDEDDSELMQMLGEVKVLRSIFYHDLVWYWGDVPFSMVPSYEATSAVYDVVDRTEILDELINDLREIAPKMTLTNDPRFSDGTERIGKDMAWAMIARLAMTAGGYSLRPDGNSFGKMERPDNYLDYYKTAALYCDSVMKFGGHALNKEFYQVFVDQCNLKSGKANTGDDIIFEIPFGKDSSGSIGYIHGPKMDNSSGETVHPWGKASSSAQLNAFYRYFFNASDVRRDFLNQMFGYSNQGEANLNNGRTVYNGKWSKLWNESGLGSATEGNTGINYPYMRYTDVLLMYAEACNEINQGPTPEAIAAVTNVRERAFRNTNPALASSFPKTDYDEFKKSILDERKFEFAGENMRWRDLVRNNMLNENAYWTFFRYFNIAYTSQTDYGDPVGMYDFDDPSWYNNNINYSIYYFNNISNNDIPDEADRFTVYQFPNQSSNIKVCWIRNLYERVESKHKTKVSINGELVNPSSTNLMNWSDDDGFPTDYFLYSMRGYIYSDEGGNVLIRDGQSGSYVSAPEPSEMPTYETLPVIRYILPYPRAVITRSMGKYENKYGYK
ncbi:MAG: RagB/SusD family nutrient uptake outer membrane protein [Duncaniella sp.]|nr:RagB/SusD family nutrient uptake outer membrane protein [Duncaniella sp.]